MDIDTGGKNEHLEINIKSLKAQEFSVIMEDKD